MTRRHALAKRTFGAFAVLLGGLIAVAMFDTLRHAQRVEARYSSLKTRINADLLTVSSWRSSPVGIALLAQAASPISEVRGPPTDPQTGMPAVRLFRALSTNKDNQYVILVPYRFAAETEWYLELFSTDGHWCTMSPWFGSTPDMTQAAWDQLWAATTETTTDVQALFAVQSK